MGELKDAIDDCLLDGPRTGAGILARLRATLSERAELLSELGFDIAFFRFGANGKPQAWVLTRSGFSGDQGKTP